MIPRKLDHAVDLRLVSNHVCISNPHAKLYANGKLRYIIYYRIMTRSVVEWARSRRVELETRQLDRGVGLLVNNYVSSFKCTRNSVYKG